MSKIKKRKNISGQYIGEPKYKKGDRVLTTLTGHDVLTIAEQPFHNGMCYMYRFEKTEMGCGENCISLAPIKPTPNTNNELKCTGGDWKASLMCGVVTTIGMTDIILPDTEEDKNLMAASKDLYEVVNSVLNNWHSNARNFHRKEPEYIKLARLAIKKANPNYK